MKSILSFTLLILYTTILTEACSPPMNYRTLDPKDVLGNMDLVVLGSFLSQQNTTETTTGRTDYVLTLNTEVDCIMKNKNSVSVGRNIKITEIRFDSWDNVNTCGDDFYDIRFNTHVAIGIRAHSDENRTSEWAFDGYNLQGPHFYWSGNNMVDVDKLTWVCGFQSPTALADGDCPDVTLPPNVECQVPETAGASRPMVESVLLLVVLSLLSVLYT